MRRLLIHAPGKIRELLGSAFHRRLALLEESSFWSGVRRESSREEWRHLTRASYVALVYHRVAAEWKPGQERLDVSPDRFRRQLRVLRLLRFHGLSVSELMAVASDWRTSIPRRSVVLTADDGILDGVRAFREHARSYRPTLFVSTATAGQRADWLDGEPIASWEELAECAAVGVTIASHARHHVVLPDLEADSLRAELLESLRDLREHIPNAVPVLAYPHGRENSLVRTVAASAGYQLAFTTAPGRNGVGTDPLALRRISVKEWDNVLAFLWKATTGDLLPVRWEKRRLNAFRRASLRRRSTTLPPETAADVQPSGEQGPPPQL